MVRHGKLLAPLSVGVLSAALQATQGVVASALGGAPSAIAGGRVGWWELFCLSLPTWLLFSLLVYPASWLAARVPFGRGRLLRPVAVHLLAGFVFAAVFIGIGAAMRYHLFLAGTTDQAFNAVLARYVQSFGNMALLLYWGIVGTWSALSYYRESESRALSAARLESLWANARLESLRLQLQPHFLFNALNAIGARAVAAGARDLAREIRTLGEFLRAHLRTDAHVVPLSEDLRLLGLYLKLQDMRFDDRLRVSMDIHESALDAEVPVLTLHTLVENAIKHAIEPSPDGGEIRIEAFRREGRLRLAVTDTGQPEEHHEGAARHRGHRHHGHGIGLESLGTRARELFGASAVLSLRPEGRGTRVVVDLPADISTEPAAGRPGDVQPESGPLPSGN